MKKAYYIDSFTGDFEPKEDEYESNEIIISSEMFEEV
jgi:hypothetical protein